MQTMARSAVILSTISAAAWAAEPQLRGSTAQANETLASSDCSSFCCWWPQHLPKDQCGSCGTERGNRVYPPGTNCGNYETRSDWASGCAGAGTLCGPALAAAAPGALAECKKLSTDPSAPSQCPAVGPVNPSLECIYNPLCVTGGGVGCVEHTGCQYVTGGATPSPTPAPTRPPTAAPTSAPTSAGTLAECTKLSQDPKAPDQCPAVGPVNPSLKCIYNPSCVTGGGVGCVEHTGCQYVQGSKLLQTAPTGGKCCFNGCDPNSCSDACSTSEEQCLKPQSEGGCDSSATGGAKPTWCPALAAAVPSALAECKKLSTDPKAPSQCPDVDPVNPSLKCIYNPSCVTGGGEGCVEHTGCQYVQGNKLQTAPTGGKCCFNGCDPNSCSDGCSTSEEECLKPQSEGGCDSSAAGGAKPAWCPALASATTEEQASNATGRLTAGAGGKCCFNGCDPNSCSDACSTSEEQCLKPQSEGGCDSSSTGGAKPTWCPALAAAALTTMDDRIFCTAPVRSTQYNNCDWLVTSGDDCKSTDANAQWCRDNNRDHCPRQCPVDDRIFCTAPVRSTQYNNCDWLVTSGDDCKSTDANAQWCRDNNRDHCPRQCPQ